MDTKNYWVNWHYRDAFIGFSNLKAEEIGVLMQIINLIYSDEKPVPNDPQWIGKNCGLRPTKCERIIHSLIHKEKIFITSDNKIGQSRTLRELESIRERRKKHSENGKKGAEIRRENKRKQSDSNSQAIFPSLANTNTKNQIDITNNSSRSAWQEELKAGGGAGIAGVCDGYDIDHHLTDEDRQAASLAAPGWDQHYLMGKYNARIRSGTHPPPDIPGAAYIGWCKKFTKGRRPD